MYVVYVLQSHLEAGSFYTGKTNNLSRRLTEHNNGKSRYTRRMKPWKVVYTETYESHSDAVKREKYLKSASGRRWIKKQFSR